MAEHTAIEWTDSTWNPVMGCTKVSPGCKHCYAERLTERFGRRFSEIQLHPDRLNFPLRWRRPRRIFVNSMSDPFHEQVPEPFIQQIFAVMAEGRAGPERRGVRAESASMTRQRTTPRRRPIPWPWPRSRGSSPPRSASSELTSPTGQPPVA
jgi:hypothetical protein